MDTQVGGNQEMQYSDIVTAINPVKKERERERERILEFQGFFHTR